MESNPLLRQIVALKQSLVDEGIMDELFVQVESLNTIEESNFAEETINKFYEEAKKQIVSLEGEMNCLPTDFSEVERLLHKLKGSCASVGASKVKCEINMTMEFCEHGNIEGAKVAVERVKTEIETFKAKVDNYFQLVKQAKETTL